MFRTLIVYHPWSWGCTRVSGFPTRTYMYLVVIRRAHVLKHDRCLSAFPWCPPTWQLYEHPDDFLTRRHLQYYCHRDNYFHTYRSLFENIITVLKLLFCCSACIKHNNNNNISMLSLQTIAAFVVFPTFFLFYNFPYNPFRNRKQITAEKNAITSHIGACKPCLDSFYCRF